MSSSCIRRGVGALAAAAMLSAALVGAVATPAGAADAVPEANAAGPFLPGPPTVFGKAPGTASDETMAVRISRAEATDRVLPEAVDYYAETYDVGEDVARRRLATQGMVPDAGPILERVLGEDFTDVWWDNETGELVVVATEEAPADAIDAALRERGLTEREYRVERVGYDSGELLDVAQRVTEQNAALTAKGLARVGVARGAITVTLGAAVGADQRRQVERASARLARAADAPPVEIEVSERKTLAAGPETWCQETAGQRYCDQIMGGAGFYNARASCTWAYFVGLTGRPTFVPSMLTAGHCINKEPTVSNQYTCRPGNVNCGSVGLSLTYYYGYGRSDVGMIDLYARGWQFYAGWWNWGPVTYTALSNHFTASPGAGYVVCKNGQTTGSSCGSVLNPTTSVAYPSDGITLSNMIEITGMTTCPGDSGSPVTSASVTWGVGIHSGSAGACANPTTASSYTSPLWEADYYLNLDIYGGGGPYGPYA